jgi:phenylpropionate dioxygenase-like ring-hydroxylating dioxygenase large terminal subunit
LSDSLIPSIHSLFNSKINLTISKTINCNFVDLLINLSDPIHFAAVHKNSAGLGLKHTGVNCNYYKETNEYCNYEIEWKGVKGRPKASWVYIYPPLVVIGVSLGNKDVVMVGNSLPIDDNKSNLVVNVYMDFDWWPFRYLQRYLARFMTSIVMQEDKNILESLTPDYSKYRDISPLDKPGRWIINKFS